MSAGRQLRDASLTLTKSLPAAGDTHYSESLDLEQVRGGEIEAAAAEVDIPATSNLVAGKRITVGLQDSADGETFADVAGLQVTVAGDGAGGNAAQTVGVRLPPGTRRYIRLSVSVESGGGDVTAHCVSLALLF